MSGGDTRATTAVSVAEAADVSKTRSPTSPSPTPAALIP